MSQPIRRAILDELATTVRAMLARSVPERVLFMTGEAGIGKSTLIAQLVHDLETAPQPPITAFAECSTPVAGNGVGFVEALKPFADIMSALVEAGIGGSGDGAKRSGEGAKGADKRPGFKLDIGKFFVDTAPSWIGLIPVIGGPIFHALNIVGSGYDQVYLHNKLRAESAGAASNQEQVFRQYINFLSKLSSEVPVLIILDDFHWADTSSTNLLFAATRGLISSNVVFLVVYRKDNVERATGKDDHALIGIRDEMERYSMSRSTEIPRASQDELEHLIRGQFPSYVKDDAFEQWLLRITNGNFLFATHFLLTLEADDFVEPGTAVLRKDLASVPVPASARAVVAGYIRRLTSDEKDQLRYASVEGETISANMAARFLGLPLLKVIARLRLFSDQYHLLRALGTQSMYATETPTYQFLHYLVHKELYESLEKTERVLLHALAADVLVEELATAEAAQFNVHRVASRLSAHAAIAGRHELAAESLMKGARWVWKSYAADEAHHFLNLCQQIVHSTLRTSPEMPSAVPQATSRLKSISLDALILQSHVYQQRSRNVEALAGFAEAITRANEYGTLQQRSRAYLGHSIVIMTTNKFDIAEEQAHIALQLALDANDVGCTAGPLLMLGNMYFRRVMLDKAQDYYEQSVEAARQTGDESLRTTGLMNLGNVYVMRGNNDVGMQCYQEVLVIRRTEGYGAGIAMVMLNIASLHDTLRRHNEALACLLEGLHYAQLAGDIHREAELVNALGIVFCNTGQYEKALDYAHRGMAAQESLENIAGIATAHVLIADVYRATDRYDEALDSLHIAIKDYESIGDVREFHRAKHYVARVTLLQNKPHEALPLMSACLDVYRSIQIPDLVLECALAHTCCELLVNAPQHSTPIKHRVSITRHALVNKTRALAGDDNFNDVAFDLALSDWSVDLAKCGLVIEG